MTRVPVSRKSSLWRLWPLALIGAGVGLFFLLGGADLLTLGKLQQEHAKLESFVAMHYLQAVLAYMLLYTLVVALSLPGGAVLTLAGGFLFGALAATCYIVVAATCGAVIIFLAARSALDEPLRTRAGPWLAKLAAGFQRDVWSYMLILRLVPLFPFFVVNLVPAFLGVSLRCFAVTTFIGIIPATFIYAALGAGLGDALRSGGDLSVALSPGVLAALLGLAALAALPILYNRLRRRSDLPNE
ncbi:TVP38/TMEM64 family protein [Dongia sp.]|uniref:TVP38/TMEM64 family protein n=1 Tax=Dongia sp. TaxID=1977262 RepID=UPI0035B3D277